MTRQGYSGALPSDAEPAVDVLRRLREHGHAALLAGGCVRDLMLGGCPDDYDVATDAPPERVQALFRATRAVGVHFGVVLVKSRGTWVEVATFRTDGDYRDGRRPERVEFRDARRDALRRDFTINGMFLDPLSGEVIDYVGGRNDLADRLVRAIGDPSQRFAEDYLRMLRAVRIAARLDFTIETDTLEAIRAHAGRLTQIAAERRLDELSRMLAAPSRARAWGWLLRTELVDHLWSARIAAPVHEPVAFERLSRLPAEAAFETALAALLIERDPSQVNALCRELTCSNEQRESIVWLVREQRRLFAEVDLPLAALKRLMAHRMFPGLLMLCQAVWQEASGGIQRAERFRARAADVSPDAVQPPPLVTGDDLLARGVPAGPRYGELLERLYTLQLDERLADRPAALAELDKLISENEPLVRPAC